MSHSAPWHLDCVRFMGSEERNAQHWATSRIIDKNNHVGTLMRNQYVTDYSQR